MVLNEKIAYLLNNQPNGIRIGCSRSNSPDVISTPFHYLSRKQQITEIETMLDDGVDWVELERELYLVCHKTVADIRRDFGLITVEDYLVDY